MSILYDLKPTQAFIPVLPPYSYHRALAYAVFSAYKVFLTSLLV